MDATREKIILDKNKPKNLKLNQNLNSICSLIAMIGYYYPNRFADLN